MIRPLKSLSFFEKLMCKVLYKVRQFALYFGHMGLYDKAFQMNFKFRFGLDLMDEEIKHLSPEGKAALRSHARMVVKMFYGYQTVNSKKALLRASAQAYRDNLLLNSRL